MTEKETCGRRARFLHRYRDEMQSRQELTVLRGEQEATVYGCCRILLYSPTEIRLLVGRHRVVSVSGCELCCVSFAAGAVRVCGRISGVLFMTELREGED